MGFKGQFSPLKYPKNRSHPPSEVLEEGSISCLLQSTGSTEDPERDFPGFPSFIESQEQTYHFWLLLGFGPFWVHQARAVHWLRPDSSPLNYVLRATSGQESTTGHLLII